MTGLGPVTPIGIGAEEFHRSQIQGKSGIAEITHFNASNLYSRIAGEVRVDVSRWLTPKEQKSTDRFTQLALIAAQLAIENSRLDLNDIDPARVGVVFGSGVGGLGILETQSRIRFERGPEKMSPLSLPLFLVNMAAAQIAIRHGFTGVCTAPATACSTGADAIVGAYLSIAMGECDVIIAGGAEAPITPMGVGTFAALHALSGRNDDPARASRPFSRDRDGFVIAEGAGALVLESYNHAVKRNAPILAEVAGFGRSADAHHLVEPHPDGRGAADAIKRCLNMAGLSTEDVGYVNAHGTSTVLNDRAETYAIKSVFGDHAPSLAISSTKSMIGHTLGAAGAIEAIATVQALISKIAPPTINLFELDPELTLNYVPHESQELRTRASITSSFAFGGQNVVLAFTQI